MLRGARDVAANPSNMSSLEGFWDKNRDEQDARRSRGSPDDHDETETTTETPQTSYSRTRGMSDAPVMLHRGRSLSTNHPATSIPQFLETFGPLVFPLYRAALLRQRILILGEAPVMTNCHFGTSTIRSLCFLANVSKCIFYLFLPR